MSGAENGGASFEWFVSLGNLLSIIISGTVVVGAIYTLVRYLKNNMTRGIEEMKVSVNREVTGMREDVKKEMSYISDKIEIQHNLMNEGLAVNMQRIGEVKQMIAQVERRVDETKHDTSKRIEERLGDLKSLEEKLDDLREEQYRLNLEVVRKLDVQVEATRKNRAEDRLVRQSERVIDKQRATTIQDSASVELDRAMETIRKRLEETEQIQDDEPKRRKATRAIHQEEDRKERRGERRAHKEEDRLTRADELKDERDIRHTDEKRREQYEGDAGKVHRTQLEEKEDPTSTQEEKEETAGEEEWEGGEENKNE